MTATESYTRRMTTRTQQRTRLGKRVGSYTPPLRAFTYWAEENWQTHEPGFVVVAPSGARMTWHRLERDAQAEAARSNREWEAQS